MELNERLDWRGREIAWGRAGEGPAVVFCHGTPWSAELWRPFAEALSAEFTVYLWDMGGYGKSSKHAEHAVDLGTQSELFADLIAEWGLDSPHIVAHDYGGAVSLRALLLGGQRYASLCLVNVVALRPWGSQFFSLVRENAEVFAALPAAIHHGVVSSYIDGASCLGLSEQERSMLVAPWLGDVGQAAFYRQIAQADEGYTKEFEARLASIAIPTQIVWGEEDVWVPVDQALRLHKLIPGSDLTLVKKAGHLVQLDAPVALATALHGWLLRVSS